jgi:putative ABC transport system permease protein
MVMILISIALFMLVLACVNYVNLTTARSAIRTKEMALKRMNGSSVFLLRLQLIGESIIISIFSLGVALTMVQLFLPIFNSLTMVNIQIGALNLPLVWAEIVGGGFLLGIISGLYPAIYLTAIQPVKLIKGATVVSSSSNLRSALMVFQFGLSVVMIVAILVNFRQLNFLRGADLGFDKEQVVLISTPGNDQPKKNDPEVALRETFRSRLAQHPTIKNISYGNGTPGTYMTNSPTMEVEGKKFAIRGAAVDEEYLSVLGIELSQGKNFTKTNFGMILNEMPSRNWG